MLNETCYDKSLLNLDQEAIQHLPKSFKLMIKIERKAQEKVNSILQDIQVGKTTLDDVKRARGLQE
jgi:hypothetical protein